MELTAAIPIDIQASMVIKQITLDNYAMAKVYDTIDEAAKKGVTLNYGQALHFMKRGGIDPFKDAMGGGAGGAGGAMKLTAGMAALAAVIVVLGLVLKKMVDNSRIANMLTSNLNKGLGLMMDLILIPFIPILVGALIGFYEIIMWLGEKWEAWVTAWEPKNAEPTKVTQEKMKEIYESPGKWASEAIANFERELREKINNAILSIKIRLSEMVQEGKDFLWKIVEYLWGYGNMVKDNIQFSLEILGDVFKVLQWLYDVLFLGKSPGSANFEFSASGLDVIESTLTRIKELKDSIQGGVDWWGDKFNQLGGKANFSGGSTWSTVLTNDIAQLTSGPY